MTVAHDGRRQVVAAADRAAQAQGLYPGMPLAQGQALIPGLAIAPADPQGDAQALAELTGWSLRYAPLTAADAPDGIWIDVTGCAHRFGAEADLLKNLVARLERGGVAARAAVADTPGAAWAMARHGTAALAVVPAGEAGAAIAPLPVVALRLPEETMQALRRLGFEHVGQVGAAARGPLARRFGPGLLHRLDQATGRIFEPIEPIFPAETTGSRLAFVEPLLTAEAFAHVIGRLTDAVCAELERRAQGARQLDLLFERVDGTCQVVRIGTARPMRTARHLTRLLEERIDQVDPGLGVEAMHLLVPLAETLRYAQKRALLLDADDEAADIAPLIDRLANRLGGARVYRVVPHQSDVPERSVRQVSPLAPPGGTLWPALPRPIRLLTPPQPVTAIAVLPDQPPAFFVWRRKRHRIRHADGPERIAGEWWERDSETRATRDYWQVEDETGRRFWLYRSGDGFDPATGNLRWFLHGFF